MKCRMTDLSRGMNGEYRLQLSTFDKSVVDIWNELYDSDIECLCKKWRKKRSLDANAYCWTLIDKLAEKLGRTKTEIYRENIRSIGGVSDTVCVQDKAVDRLTREWGRNGLGWFCEWSESRIPGCKNVTMYYGSSSYDTKQMAALIDNLVQDCKAVGIETLPPHELEAIQHAWGNKANKSAE